MATVYIALGSNIDPHTHMAECCGQLKEALPGIVFSSLYHTAPREREHQDDFLNAVSKVQTDLSPEALQKVCTTIEKALGKDPPYKNGPRTIDLDILLYDSLILRKAHLHIPHPRMHERRFVLEPLCELIDTDTMHPTLKETWKTLLHHVRDQECRKLP